MLRLRDILDKTEGRLQLGDKGMYIDLDLDVEMDGKRCELFSERMLDREIDWIESNNSITILYLKEVCE